MRNVVVDTNVPARAFLKPGSNDGRVMAMALDGKVQLWLSEGFLSELIRVLSYPRLQKYHVTKANIAVFLGILMTYGKFITPQTTKLCRDSDDNEILGIALAVAVNNASIYLITADQDILILKGTIGGIHILTPQEFLK